MSNSKVIYTSLTGGYDVLKQPDSIRTDYDYICFSNDLGEADIGVWKIRAIPFVHDSKTRLTRFPKLNPHVVLPEYEASVWVDGNIVIDEELFTRAEELLEAGATCAMCPHPDRSSVYEEARILIRLMIGEPLLVYRQAAFMLSESFREPGPLCVCSVIFRRHHVPRIVAFSKCWWEQYQRFSCRDQMSVNYAMKQAGVVPELFRDSDFIARHTRNFKRPEIHNFGRVQEPWPILLPRKTIRFFWRHFLLFRLHLLYRRNDVPWS